MKKLFMVKILMKKLEKSPLQKKERNTFSLSEEIIIKLAAWTLKIEEYYSKLKNSKVSVDVEWALDGIDQKLYIVQAREETTISKKIKRNEIIEYNLNKIDDIQSKPVISGIAVGDGVANGKIKIMHSLDSRETGIGIEDFKPGDILVTDMTDPDWEPLMKISSGIITNRGGRTCHAAIIARELNVPAVVGTQNATQILEEDQSVTVSCCEGETGFVYDGFIEYTKNIIDLSKLPKTKTKIMLNVGNPDIAFGLSGYPNSGVGLARLEFIINNFIKVHPCALIDYDNNYNKQKENLQLSPTRRNMTGKNKLYQDLSELIKGYDTGKEYYINKLAYGIAKIGAAFYPNDVIVRFSDFKSNEYKKLLGGSEFELDEDNPMIGYRGCSRYYSDEFKEAFKLECKAIKKVREEIGLENVIVMLPFCRTTTECEKVLSLLEENEIPRHKNNLQVYLMCEIPSNVILADEFHKMVDGISFGTNDLTSLILGLDRDGEKVQHIFDERNPAVKKMISWAIKSAKAAKIKTCLCGQAPSDHSDFAKFLVEENIDSFSITPDSVVKTLKTVYEIENDF